MQSINPIQIANIKRIQNASRNGRLVLFVGAGVSKNSGVPMWSELIEKMKEELPESIKNEKDDLKIAQLYKDSRGEKEFLEMVAESLCHNKVIPNAIHKELLALSPVHIITTNYDDLIEQEIRNEYKQFAIVRCDKDIPNMEYPNALIKMHGDYLNGNIVLAENDYYNYSKNFALTRAFVQSLFASKLILFVGFSFADLNLKMILNDVRNILEERMQPVYFLSLDKPDDVTKKYLEGKGITIVYLEDFEITELLSLVKHNNIKTVIKDNYGNKLYRCLKVLRFFDVDATSDLISYIYKKIIEYQDQIRTYGSGLKYLFPTYLGELYFNEYYEGIQTFQEYFNNLESRMKTLSQKKDFIKKYGSKMCRDLICFAYDNDLYCIDELTVLGNNFEFCKSKYIPITTIDLLHNFDFKSFENRLKDLSLKQLTGTLDDMEYPYALYSIGAYDKACLGFEKILPLAWKRKKYIVYFLCLYNMWTLRYAIRNIYSNEADYAVDRKHIFDKLSDINIHNILSNLPLSYDIKKLLQDILSNLYASNKAVESDKLKDELYRQRKMAERGGFSLNSNIVELIAKYQREKHFSERNYVLSDFNKYTIALTRNTIAGILNSYATKDIEKENSFGCHNTKITALDAEMLDIMIFGLDNQDLRDMFSKYEIYDICDIKIDDEGKRFLNNCIINLDTDHFKKYQSYLILGKVTNLLYLIGVCDSIEIDIPTLYRVIDTVWKQPIQRSDLSKFLDIIIYKFQPSPKVALNLLYEILKNPQPYYKTVVTKLCEIISKGNLKIDNIDIYISQKICPSFIKGLYSIIPDTDKLKLVKYGERSLPNIGLEYYLEFMYTTHSVPESTEAFSNLLLNNNYNNRVNNTFICKYLAEWRKDNQYKNLWGVIDKYKEHEICLQFFTDLKDFANPEKVDIEWILACHEDVIKDLMTQPIYTEKLKDYISEAKLNPKQRRSLLSLL